MRRPLASLGRVPHHARFRDVVRPCLLAHLAQWPQALDRVGQITTGSGEPDLSGPPLGLDGEPLQELRVKIAASVGQPAPGAGPGLTAAFIRAFVSLAGDPDRDLAAWVEAGAPLGAHNHLSSAGIFPVLAEDARNLLKAMCYQLQFLGDIWVDKHGIRTTEELNIFVYRQK